MRDHFILVGTSFRRAGFDRLGSYVLSLEDPRELAELRAACGARELVYVATCNRVEVYLATERPGADPAARVAEFFAARGRAAAQVADFFVRTNESALDHLFAVVASLDSLVLGECEIAGQVRRAADLALKHGLAGRFLERIFEQAARSAKRVRSETAIGRTPVSVASLILRRMREHFKDSGPRRAVLVGVGDVTKKVAGALERGPARLLFVNRTESRAAALAARYGGEAMSLERFRTDPPAEIDLLVTATRAPDAIVDLGTLGRALDQPRNERAFRPGGGGDPPGRSAPRPPPPVPPLLVCDLGVPPDVDPAVGAHPGVRLLTLADLEATAQENRQRLAGEVARVQAIVREEAARAGAELRMRAVARESVDAMLAGGLAHLPEKDRETVRRFATHLAERLARQPS